jgi:hypothetical protein
LKEENKLIIIKYKNDLLGNQTGISESYRVARFILNNQPCNTDTLMTGIKNM